MKKFAGENELLTLYGQFRKMIPENYHYEIKKLQNMLEPARTAGAFISMDLHFDPVALNTLYSLTQEDIDEVVDNFIALAVEKLKSKYRRDYVYYGKLVFQDNLTQHKNNAPTALYFSDRKMDPIKQGLGFVFTEPTSQAMAHQQWSTFTELRKNIIFRDFGSAFLVRMLEKATIKQGLQFQNLIYFTAHFKRDGENEKRMHIGQYVRPTYTQALIRDRDRVLNRAYNPLHFDETNLL